LKLVIYGAIIVVAVAVTGYLAFHGRLTWESGWVGLPAPNGADLDSAALLRRADELTDQADTKERLEAVMELQERVIAADPLHFEASWKLSRNTRFFGQVYAQRAGDRQAHYLRAIQLAERALYSNPAFRAAIHRGVAPWHATETLAAADLPAAHYYFLGVFSMFLTELGDFGKLLNAHWIGRMKAFVTRMLELDDTWAGGHPYYDRALYLCQLPSFLGGDLEQAGRDLEKAIEIGPKWVNNYYMRARVYRTRTGDREGFIRDLEHIATMDPRDSDAPYPNSAEYIRQARLMLENVDAWFAS
jgi:tetratricopeptide (TPR) repeat protein